MNSSNLPLILVTEGSDPGPLQWLAQRARVVEVRYDAAEFAGQLADADALVVRTYTKVNSAMLDCAPRLKVVGRGGVGLENIDVATCRKRGVEVVYTPSANTIAVGDFVMGGLLRLIRPWAAMSQRILTADEFKKARAALRGRQLDELTMGILGMGRVGRRVGHIAANGFGMRVIYNDLVDPGELDFAATSVDKPTLFRTGDVLSIHVDMRPGNENLVGAEQIAMMKPDAILINTARGEVLDINALTKALREKRLAGAMLDVYWPEPPSGDFPMVGFDNVLLTPHLAARTTTAMENMSWVVKDVMAVLEKRKPQFPAPNL